MGQETQSKVIDGIEFECTQFNPWKAYGLSAKVLQIFGSSLFAGGFQNLDLSQISADQFIELSSELLSNMRAKGKDDKGRRWYTLDKQENIDHVFAGKVLTIYKVVMFSVQVNFSGYMDFLGDGQSDAPDPKVASEGKAEEFNP